MGFPGGSDNKEFTCNADPSSVPGLERSPESLNLPIQIFLPGNSMDIGFWGATVHGITKSWTQPSD